MASGDTTIAVTAIVASTVIVITVVICTAFLYSKYIRRFKSPSVHPTHDEAPRDFRRPEVDGENRLHPHEHARANANVPSNIDRPMSQHHVINLPDGSVTKPRVGISLEMLAVYRSMWKKSAGNLIQPPGKVPQLYSEKTMVLYQKQLEQTFTLPHQQTRSKITASRSRVNPCSSRMDERDLVKELHLAVDTFKCVSHTKTSKTEHENSDLKTTRQTNSEIIPDAPAIGGMETLERPLSSLSCYSEAIVDGFVRPGDVDLGEM